HRLHAQEALAPAGGESRKVGGDVIGAPAADVFCALVATAREDAADQAVGIAGQAVAQGRGGGHDRHHAASSSTPLQKSGTSTQTTTPRTSPKTIPSRIRRSSRRMRAISRASSRA